MDQYGQALLRSASRLDALTDACGEISRLAADIVEEDRRAAAVVLLKKISETLDDAGRPEAGKAAILVHASLLEFYGHQTIQEICRQKGDGEEDPRTLDELLDELHALVGLEKVKQKVQDLIAYQKVQKLRQENHLHWAKNTLHLAFTGNPGTGKTTVARIVGRIYRRIGLLSRGHFVEVSRTDLIAGYQGQTALKVKKVIEQAKGGVLFIDEAYSITENDHADSYGRECLTELTKALEDYREDLVVIVAGYTEPMKKFFASNPGLRSRFNTWIEFDDYGAEELDRILDDMCRKNDYVLDPEAKEKIHGYFEQQTREKEENFANGRLARNLYDDMVMHHARRVVRLDHPGIGELSTLKAEDCAFEQQEARMG